MLFCVGFAIDDYAGKEDKLMKKYEKHNMEVIDVQNDVIVTSGTVKTCAGGILTYCTEGIGGDDY